MRWVVEFDTSIFHDAVNDSDEYRYILMLKKGKAAGFGVAL